MTFTSEYMTDAEYFAHPAMNQSGFKPILKSALYYQYRLDEPLQPSHEIGLGKVCHCKFLESEDEFRDRFVFYNLTKGVKTKKCTEFMAKLNKGQEIYTQSMLDTSKNMLKNLDDIELPGHHMREFTGISTMRGFAVKAKADWFDDDGWLWDYKTTSKLDKFEWVIRDFGYDIQAMWYLSVFAELEPKGFKILAQSTTRPHDKRIFEFTPETLMKAQQEIIRGFDLYEQCLESGDWPGRSLEPTLV